MARLPLAVQRMEFEGLGFSLVLAPGWKGVAMDPLNGAFISLAERPHEAVLNLRCLLPEEQGFALTPGSLEAQLRGREWGAPATGLLAWSAPPLLIAGASFEPAGERTEWVREWLITDGASVASGLATPLICLQHELTQACEEMLRSLRFG
jgi:hypothetical protein